MIKKYSYIDLDKEKEVVLADKNIIIWGCSISALNLYVNLKTKGFKVIGFTDSFTRKEDIFADLPLYPYENVIRMENVIIYISTTVRKNRIQILELLKEEEVLVCLKGTVWGPYDFDKTYMKKCINNAESKIAIIKSLLRDEKSVKTFDNLLNYRTTNNYKLIEEIYEMEHHQYFPGREILIPTNEEIFVDAGAYNGATSVEFARWVNEKYKKIYLMEPDSLMQSVMKEYLKLHNMHDIEIVRKGAYSRSTVLQFACSAESGSSKISEIGTESVDTISIDEMLNGSRATYIKMDIEGAELEALEGAAKTITTYRPNLAISIYHKEDDLWEIPYYIHQNYPWYKLYIRHYELTTNETVLYAVV